MAANRNPGLLRLARRERGVMPARPLKYAWQQEFRAAPLELKPADLMRRITEAEAAVFDRFQKISKDSEHIQERTAL